LRIARHHTDRFDGEGTIAFKITVRLSYADALADILLQMEDENPLEAKEKLDELAEHKEGWTRYLALTTAFIAVLAALASMKSGGLANEALLAKNDAILSQSKASDQWNYYQAKGIKRTVDEGFAATASNPKLKSEATRYASEQKDIQEKARSLDKEVETNNVLSEKLLQRHEKAASSVTFFQIAIALSAMAALMKQKSYWIVSMALAAIGAGYLVACLGWL